MYTLDFETMKQVMQEHRKTGYLRAEVLSGIAGMQGPCRVEVKLVVGAVVSCFIYGGSGQRLSEKDSLKQVARLGRLKWIFTPQDENTALTIPAVVAPPPKAPVFPQRTVYLEQWQMQSWPRLHRTVFALADGTRSIEKIAEVLSAAPDVIDKALRDLQSIGVVTMEPRNGTDRLDGRNRM
jgi:hypothetical protein